MKKTIALLLILMTLLSLCACGGDEPPTTTGTTACSHTWKEATCTAPKTCTKCGATEGSATAHTYAEGFCTVCGREDLTQNFTGNTWTAYRVSPGDAQTGEVLSEFSLMATEFEGFAHKDYYANVNYQGDAFDEITYNGKTYYDFWFSSDMDGIAWDDQGDTVTVVFPYAEPVTEITLTRSGETEFTVTASSDEAKLPVGTVFHYVPQEG